VVQVTGLDLALPNLVFRVATRSLTKQARGENPGDLAGALLGAEKLGSKDVRPHGDSGLEMPTAAFAWRPVRCLAGSRNETYLLTTRLGFEMTDGV
jgi:hypothetical protein